MRSDSHIVVEVILSLLRKAHRCTLLLPHGATLAQAVEQSGLLRKLDIEPAGFGIFGENCEPERVLADGDRVEIYRPLECDPMEARRRRAAAG